MGLMIIGAVAAGAPVALLVAYGGNNGSQGRPTSARALPDDRGDVK